MFGESFTRIAKDLPRVLWAVDNDAYKSGNGIKAQLWMDPYDGGTSTAIDLIRRYAM